MTEAIKESVKRLASMLDKFEYNCSDLSDRIIEHRFWSAGLAVTVGWFKRTGEMSTVFINILGDPFLLNQNEQYYLKDRIKSAIRKKDGLHCSESALVKALDLIEARSVMCTVKISPIINHVRSRHCNIWKEEWE